MEMSRLISFVFVAALALAACASRPTGVLAPVAATVPGASTVDVLVATTRSSIGATAGELFTGERGRGMSFADIAVSIPPDQAREAGQVQWPTAIPGDPATSFVTLRADKVDRDEALKRFSARLQSTSHRRVLVFVHGYNTKFEDAVFRFAQIVHDGHTPALPILFTWPSRGRLLAYPYDRESANYSRYALETVLQALAKDKSVKEVAVLAHSMGNWVTLEALRTMAIRDGRIAPKIKSIILAAPDVDFDVFRRDIAEIGVNRPPITIFVSQDDEALAWSSRFWGDVPRLGAVDPEQEPYRTELERAHVNVIDLTNVKSSDRLNHAKFAQSPEIVEAIGFQLANGQTLSDNKGGLGERIGQMANGANSTFSTAAGVLVATPVALVDPRTRENLADQLRGGAQPGGIVAGEMEDFDQKPTCPPGVRKDKSCVPRR
jgi:esterase/lipase superfamily enzyme